MATREKDYNIEKEFTIERPHRLAQIERLYDFEDDPEPRTIVAVDPATEDTIAHFRVESNGAITDLSEPPAAPAHVLTSHALGVAEVREVARTYGQDFPEGLSLGELDSFIETAKAAGMSGVGVVHAWTRDDGTIHRLAVV